MCNVHIQGGKCFEFHIGHSNVHRGAIHAERGSNFVAEKALKHFWNYIPNMLCSGRSSRGETDLGGEPLEHKRLLKVFEESSSHFSERITTDICIVKI